MATISELSKDLCSSEQVKAYQARRELTKAAAEAGASDAAAKRAELAKDLATALAAITPAKDGRGEPTLDSIRLVEGAADLCRALALVGGDMEVPAVKNCLSNIDLREAARWCLSRMNCQAATDALVECLKNTSGTEFRVGVVNALGRKSGSSVVDTLKGVAADDHEPEMRLAAAEALAEQPLAALDAAIAAVDPGSSSRGKARVARARIRLANTLLRNGDQAGAKTVFEAVAGADVDEAQKNAASAALKTLG
jgi:hypothetical protein